VDLADRRRLLAIVVARPLVRDVRCHGNILEPTACSLQVKSGGTSPEFWSGWYSGSRTSQARKIPWTPHRTTSGASTPLQVARRTPPRAA